jgi:PBP4 family serine-type D-alanyl-D-alanine carboxypeptidase
MSKGVRRRCGFLLAITVAVAWWATTALAKSKESFEERVAKIMSRPEFAHSRFGIEFISADTGKTVYQLNPQQFFVPGSTTKLMTMGTALKLLGENYRFSTKIYRTGKLKKSGSLLGDLVLVAGGDLNLSNRVQPDDTLAFENVDHSYGGADSNGLAGDPLQVVRDLAKQVAAKGIKRVEGKVVVDATLFPEGERELGTNVVISPIMVNDNVVDTVVSPGPAEGSPLQLKLSPQTGYVTILNQATTGKAGTTASLKYQNETINSDGTRRVTLTGSLPLDARPTLNSYPVPEPSRFAATVLVEALREQGIAATLASPGDLVDFGELSANYTANNLVAEHVSPPLKEEVKVTLKVSQNVHASCVPFLLGALLARKTTEIDKAGFDLENKFLSDAGLDLSGAAQSDGAGGNAYFTPDFMVHYLLYLSKQKEYQDFYNALPILGIDGTLFNIQVHSVAAGHVHAKTGTYGGYDALNHRIMVSGKALAGYMDTSKGQHLILAVFVNTISVPDNPEAIQKIAGEALGEISAAAFDSPFVSSPTPSNAIH